MDDESSPQHEAQDKPDLALDLNFVPGWARTPPDNPYAGREHFRDDDRRRDRGGGGRDRRGGGGRRDGPRGRGGFRPGGGGSGGGRRPGERGGGGGRNPHGAGRDPRGGDRRDRRGGGRPPRSGEDRRAPREPRPRLNVKIAFLPDRERLALVVRDIQASGRAFPLVEIAGRFLARDDLYLVKMEWPPAAEGRERPTFTQCLLCRRAFRTRAEAEAHLLDEHLDHFFEVEETTVEPPSGTFACVARCGLSGTLLGPPNHHGYNEKIQELWSTRFGHMSKADYLGHVETVRDEALVEQWKDALRKQTVYRLKEPPEGETPEPLDRAAAREWMRAKLNPLLRESPRCMVPGTQARRISDGPLRSAVAAAWQKEKRFPLTLLLALRPAFRHMHLHLFKVNAKETFVTAIQPVPVDLTAAPAIVQEVAAFLEAHPGIPRRRVLEELRPGADPESKEAADLLLHLGNLVAAGSVIEFFDGTLALPHGRPARKEEEAKAPEPAADKPAEAPAAEPAVPADESVAAAAAEPAPAERKPDAAPAAEEPPPEPAAAGSADSADSAEVPEDVPQEADPAPQPDKPAVDAPAAAPEKAEAAAPAVPAEAETDVPGPEAEPEKAG